jgi:uncharacterized protein (DUF2252 family)
VSATIAPINERAALGKAARAAVGRRSHGDWEPSPARGDPVDVLAGQALTRVPELVPIRHARMLVSPFTFYRGAAALMAGDLAGAPRTDLEVQLCGDAHLSNFGAFAAPDRRLVFSLNDFDETLPGPFEWDVKRMAASFVVAGEDLGLDAGARRTAAMKAVRAYREAMAGFADQGMMDVWYARIDIDDMREQWGAQLGGKRRERFERNVAKARAKTNLRAFAKLTERVDGRVRIAADPPLIVPIEDAVAPRARAGLEAAIVELIASYRETLSDDRRRLLDRFRYAHAARKVVGVGSVGTRAWIVLLLGRDDEDPLFLQVKEAEPSVLEPYLRPTAFATQGQRVVEGQRMMQSASDVLLGWLRTDGVDGVTRDYYVRQLWDAKGSALVELMDARVLGIYAEVCGWTLARAHARSGDAVAIASYLGHSDTFDRSLAAFAESYAAQNQRDYDAFTEAAATGRIPVQEEL